MGNIEPVPSSIHVGTINWLIPEHQRQLAEEKKEGKNREGEKNIEIDAIPDVYAVTAFSIKLPLNNATSFADFAQFVITICN